MDELPAELAADRVAAVDRFQRTLGRKTLRGDQTIYTRFFTHSQNQQINIKIFSEAMSRTATDNFTTYVPTELYKRTNSHRQKYSKAPRLSAPIPPIELIPGDPSCVLGDDNDHCQFIQLVDLLTGAINQAVNVKATQEIKYHLGSRVASMVEDTRLAPWFQTHGLHRKFSISCFPDPEGGFYDIQLPIATINQPSFFDA